MNSCFGRSDSAEIGVSVPIDPVASSPSEVEARAFLARTNKVAPGILAEASGFTVTFEKDGVTYYRARYGGFGSKSEAWNACSALKKKKVDCYAVQQ